MAMPGSEDNLAQVRRYLKTIEGDAFCSIADLFTPDMVMEQLPSRIYPKSGVSRTS